MSWKCKLYSAGAIDTVRRVVWLVRYHKLSLEYIIAVCWFSIDNVEHYGNWLQQKKVKIDPFHSPNLVDHNWQRTQVLCWTNTYMREIFCCCKKKQQDTVSWHNTRNHDKTSGLGVIEIPPKIFPPYCYSLVSLQWTTKKYKYKVEKNRNTFWTNKMLQWQANDTFTTLNFGPKTEKSGFAFAMSVPTWRKPGKSYGLPLHQSFFNSVWCIRSWGLALELYPPPRALLLWISLESGEVYNLYIL